MLRQVVSSGIVKSVGYDPGRRLLEVEFMNGWVYEYEDVPRRTFQELMSAPSHGRYLKRHIVDQFETQRTR